MDRSNFMSQTSAGRLFSYISEPGSVIDLSREIVHLRVCIRLRGQEGLCVKLDENQLWAESQLWTESQQLKVNSWKSTVSWKPTAESQLWMKVNRELKTSEESVQGWTLHLDSEQLEKSNQRDWHLTFGKRWVRRNYVYDADADVDDGGKGDGRELCSHIRSAADCWWICFEMAGSEKLPIWRTWCANSPKAAVAGGWCWCLS